MHLKLQQHMMLKRQLSGKPWKKKILALAFLIPVISVELTASSSKKLPQTNIG